MVFGVAVALRVVVVLSVAHEPVWDGQYYHRGAERIAAGSGYGDTEGTWSHYPVGYSAFLAPFYAVLGANPVVGAMAGALVGGLTAVAVARLAREMGSRTRALAAGGVAALHPGLVAQAGVLMSEALAGLLLVVAAVSVVKLRERRWLAAVVGGGVVGAATLVRPASLLVLPAVVLLALDGGDGDVAPADGARLRWKRAAVACAFVVGGAVAVVAPWTARNCATLDACAVVSTNGGWNAAIGASPRATGRFEEVVAEDGCGGITGPVAEDTCWRGRAVAWIAADAARWAALVPKKWSYTFDHQAFAIASFAEADPAAWSAERKARWMRALAIVQGIVFACAALGVAAVALRGGWKRRAAEIGVGVLGFVAFATGAAWPLAIVVAVLGSSAAARRGAGVVGYAGWAVATVAVVHAVFFGEDRYQVVVEPLLCVLASACFRGGTEPAALVASAA